MEGRKDGLTDGRALWLADRSKLVGVMIGQFVRA